MPRPGDIVRAGDVTTLGTPTWSTFTPTWTAAGGGNSLGNGTLQGRWCQAGKIVFFHIRLVLGSTSTPGTGRYAFGGLPVSRAGFSLQAVNVYVEDAGGLRYGGTAQVDGSGIFAMNLGNLEIAGNVPMVWGVNDSITVSGFYESV